MELKKRATNYNVTFFDKTEKVDSRSVVSVVHLAYFFLFSGGRGRGGGGCGIYSAAFYKLLKNLVILFLSIQLIQDSDRIQFI